MVLAAALSLLIGLSLGMLGGGGSILTVPIMVYALGVEERAAMASSLLVVGTTSLVALVRPARTGVVAWRTGLVFALAGMTGSFFGGRLSGSIPKSVLLLGFAMMMLGTGVAMLRKRADTVDLKDMQFGKALVVGVLTGTLTGLVGAGGGFVIVPALALVGGLPLRNAIGTSLLVIALQSFAGFVGHASHITVDYPLVGTITAAASVGALGGGFLGARVSQEHLRRAFGVFVLVMAVYMGWKQLTAKPVAAPSPSTPAAAASH
jgi:uncharacterized membrane protein YfcA